MKYVFTVLIYLTANVTFADCKPETLNITAERNDGTVLSAHSILLYCDEPTVNKNTSDVRYVESVKVEEGAPSVTTNVVWTGTKLTASRLEDGQIEVDYEWSDLVRFDLKEHQQMKVSTPITEGFKIKSVVVFDQKNRSVLRSDKYKVTIQSLGGTDVGNG